MKKKMILSLAISALALVFAPNINAAETNLEYFGSNAAITSSTTDAQTTANGNSITLTPIDGKYIAYIGAKGTFSTGSLKTASFTVVTSKGYSIDLKNGVKGSGSYSNPKVELVNTDATTGKSYYYVTLTSATGLTKVTGYSAENAIAVVTYTKSATATGDCSLELSAACAKTSTSYKCKDGKECTQEEYAEACEAKICKVIDGKDGQKIYYDANGNVTDEANFNAYCTKTENPETGSYLPVAIIASALVVAFGVFFITKRSKIYHV